MSEKVLNHFPFYRSYAEAIITLNEKQRLSLYDGIVNFAFYGVEYTPIDKETQLAFTLMKPILETTIKKVLGGSKRTNKKDIAEGKPKWTTEERLNEALYLYQLDKFNRRKYKVKTIG